MKLSNPVRIGLTVAAAALAATATTLPGTYGLLAGAGVAALAAVGIYPPRKDA